ncbi:conserved hypothetical protein [Pediculus humanus corporis]|uniref:XRCC4 coiled-coil domain-containing protein n=1 Tax=Pediculus humanus subsp. corporis TaxID=121224 RepID=E0VI21_PEDHC|nr:uncharacterized protein Phum_PHUM219790 [Pediculus humanus corporis]EEB13027.1 conserved hypothetical protein [Pediculus humanus corporis]
MDSVEEEFVCSVDKEDLNGYYRLHTIWKKNSFIINITSKNGAWSGECKEILTTHNGYPKISYMVQNGCFVWKKIIDEDSGIKLKIGSVKLLPANFEETVQKCLTVALNSNDKLKKEVGELKKENEKNLSENKKLFSKLDEITNVKINMETDLYKKFQLLLNTKKEKIAYLENIISRGKIDESFNPYDVDTENEDDHYTDDDNDDIIKKTIETNKSDFSKSDIICEISENNLFKEKSKETEDFISNKKIKEHESYVTIDNPDNETTKINNSDIEQNKILDESNSNKTSESKNFPSTKEELLTFFYGS